MSALGFVVLPLLVYIPMFLVEFYIAFRRIGKPLDKGGEYLHATWEVTHTFLILSVNYFMWLFSDAIVDVGKAVFVPLITFGAIFIVRAILYVYLFYIKKTNKPNLVVDWLFALCHVVMLVCLLYIAIAAIEVLLSGNYTPNQFLPSLLYPGIFLMVPLVAMPIYFLYKTKKR